MSASAYGCLLLVFVLLACSPPVMDGRLIEKRYTPASTVYVPVYHRIGKYGGVTTIIPIHRPERFEAKIYYERDRHGDEDWIAVDAITYAKLEPGWELRSGCWSEPPMKPLTLETK